MADREQDKDRMSYQDEDLDSLEIVDESSLTEAEKEAYDETED